MSGPLYRGGSAYRLSDNSLDTLDSDMKDKSEKEEFDRRGSSDQRYLDLSLGSTRSRHKLAMLLVKLSLVIIVFVTLTGSLWFMTSISTSSQGRIQHNYRRLQERILSDLWDIGEISLGSSTSKELEFCSRGLENHVPCFNVSENLELGYTNGKEYDRYCGHSSRQNCLVVPPLNYKVPLRWPTGKDVIWISNVKITAQEVLSSGSLTKRMMMLEEEQISFRSSPLTIDGIEDYSHQIVEMIGLRNESSLLQAGVRTILDIGCGFGSFGAHLFTSQILTMCIANYESSGSQIQITLERGLPGMVGNLTSQQFPFPSLSYDMLHCSRCGIDWDQKDGLLLIEVNRVLKPGGYFVWTSPLTNSHGFVRNEENQKRWTFIRIFAEGLCWEMLSQQDETVVWKKASKRNCYSSRQHKSGPSICSKGQDIESPYYRPLQECIGGTKSGRWIPIEERKAWPFRADLNKTELAVYGLRPEELKEDAEIWKGAVQNYWSLLSPIIFSDHPKRPGDEDPSPPYNMFRNVLDMNALFGGFNSALLEAGKSVWVMNVSPISGPNYLPLILDRGLIGVLHNWCEPFPTYPRTYDLVHAAGLLSLEMLQQRKCSMLHLLTEIDRILRPEGWVIIRDVSSLIKSARALARELKWDARIIELESTSDESLLICQKPFLKRLTV